jgi:hypothetical protein
MFQAIAHTIRRRLTSAGFASLALIVLLIGAPIAATPASAHPRRSSSSAQGVGAPYPSVVPRTPIAHASGLFGFLIKITAPQSDATYAQGQTVAAAYSCTALASLSPTECAGPVANGAAIDTSTLGVHTFTVNGQYGSRLKESSTVEYMVTATGKPLPLSLSRIRQTAKIWRTGSALARISAARKRRRPPVGTTFSFSLSQAATVSFTFMKHASGRRLGGKCVAPTPKNRKRRGCTRTVQAGLLTFKGHAGTNRARFDGVLVTRRKLTPGRYTLRAVARALGKSSRTRTASFTIAKG